MDTILENSHACNHTYIHPHTKRPTLNLKHEKPTYVQAYKQLHRQIAVYDFPPTHITSLKNQSCSSHLRHTVVKYNLSHVPVQKHSNDTK